MAPGAALAQTPTLNPSGTLTFSWRGDPARGCQAAGVCDVSGSLDVVPDDLSGSSESPPSRNFEIVDEGAVVRVTDPGSTATQPHICTQLAPVDMFMSIVRLHSSGLQAIVVPFSPPTSGDCAGPSALSLGNFSRPARRLPGPREAYDLSAIHTFGSGPYAVTLRSTIRARRPSGPVSGGLELSGGSGGDVSTGSKPHTALVEQVSIEYRITTTNGTVATTFAGRPDPFCLPLDACGANGTIDARRVVTRRASRHRALADLRSGRLPLEETGDLVRDVLSANVGWSAGSDCTQRIRQFNALSIDVTASGDGRKALLRLATDRTEDPFRTACPGPSVADVLASSDTLAQASLPLRQLGRSRLRIPVSAHGRFVAGSYAGARSGGVTLGLRLVGVRAGTKTETVIP
jgi:hypothetical protein